ncbi:hypothetical protein BDN71DRAFT_1511815 [Pleurotus eryngii]|uniref:Uncharacterized protein n=1 Tax=Pleurotus eryngii TaxID=5323 RepID=A0A9P5ZL58_PLEER|nr:hypothetical protein BDN71DRAFT_1511815 [Pleurotus eryngii]
MTLTTALVEQEDMVALEVLEAIQVVVETLVDMGEEMGVTDEVLRNDPPPPPPPGLNDPNGGSNPPDPPPPGGNPQALAPRNPIDFHWQFSLKIPSSTLPE